MQIGIELCKKNITKFLDDARLIAVQGRLSHAYVPVELAIEEFGKIVMLKEALESANDPIEVDDAIFTKHNQKSEKAWTVLDTKYRLIFDEGHWEEGFRKRRESTHITFASHRTRCECAFVDFVGGQWTCGCSIKRERLQDLISHIEEKVKAV